MVTKAVYNVENVYQYSVLTHICMQIHPIYRPHGELMHIIAHPYSGRVEASGGAGLGHGAGRRRRGHGDTEHADTHSDVAHAGRLAHVDVLEGEEHRSPASK